MRKVVLFINVSSVYGGQEHYIEECARELVNRRIIDAHFAGGPEKLRKSGVFGSTYALSDSFVSVFEQLYRRESPLQRESFDWVVLNGNRALYTAFHPARVFAPGRVIYIQHTALSDSQGGALRAYLRGRLLPLFAKGCSKIVRVSHASLPIGEDSPHLVTIPPGIDLRRFSEGSSPKNSPPRLLMVGALTKNKHQDLALELLARVSRATLTLAGDGPEHQNLVEKAQVLGVMSRVEFLGVVDDPVELYRTSDILLILSETEGIPYALLEAMACGLCVIARSVGGIPEVLEHRRSGILLPEPFSAELLEREVLHLLSAGEERRALGRRAAERVSRDFSLEKMISSFDEILRR